MNLGLPVIRIDPLGTTHILYTFIDPSNGKIVDTLSLDNSEISAIKVGHKQLTIARTLWPRRGEAKARLDADIEAYEWLMENPGMVSQYLSEKKKDMNMAPRIFKAQHERK